MSTVSIVRGEDVSVMVSEALDLLGGLSRFVSSADKVLIKPNVCGGIPSKIGTFTSQEVVSALVSLLKDKVEQISVGESDSSMYLADKMLKECGIIDLAEKIGIAAVNLSKGDMVEVKVENGYTLDSIRVNRILTEATKIISAPVAKTHATTDVSLNLKNMYGILPGRKKGNLHSKIDYLLADIMKAFPPSLCIIDATTALEGEGPFHGEPVKLGLVVAGDNAVATDNVMASIMGYDSEKIMHLRLASERGLGPINLNEIHLKGENIMDVKREFKKSRREPFSRPLARIPELGHLLVHYYYESAVKAWKKKSITPEK